MKNKVHLYAKLTPDIYSALAEEATKQGRSISNLAAFIIAEYLIKLESKQYNLTRLYKGRT